MGSRMDVGKSKRSSKMYTVESRRWVYGHALQDCCNPAVCLKNVTIISGETYQTVRIDACTFYCVQVMPCKKRVRKEMCLIERALPEDSQIKL